MTIATELGISEEEIKDAVNLEKIFSLIKSSYINCSKCQNKPTHVDCNNVEFLCTTHSIGKSSSCKQIAIDRFTDFEIQKLTRKFGKKNTTSLSIESTIRMPKSKRRSDRTHRHRHSRSSRHQRHLRSSSKDSGTDSYGQSESDVSYTSPKETKSHKSSSKNSKSKVRSSSQPTFASTFEVQSDSLNEQFTPNSNNYPPGMAGILMRKQLPHGSDMSNSFPFNSNQQDSIFNSFPHDVNESNRSGFPFVSNTPCYPPFYSNPQANHLNYQQQRFSVDSPMLYNNSSRKENLNNQDKRFYNTSYMAQYDYHPESKGYQLAQKQSNLNHLNNSSQYSDIPLHPLYDSKSTSNMSTSHSYNGNYRIGARVPYSIEPRNDFNQNNLYHRPNYIMDQNTFTQNNSLNNLTSQLSNPVMHKQYNSYHSYNLPQVSNKTPGNNPFESCIESSQNQFNKSSDLYNAQLNRQENSQVKPQALNDYITQQNYLPYMNQTPYLYNDYNPSQFNSKLYYSNTSHKNCEYNLNRNNPPNWNSIDSRRFNSAPPMNPRIPHVATTQEDWWN